ncbi:L,D-transpeptidase family protein [Hymenobacter sp.]|uniref:L,D-transpeptidase family protein n=1 Tax=Hymenobacter sp. TaxID=1898978 RepID=UPI00286B68EC|nr:L,D-transpeptidase family protein [Hymenobacter sp.]
MQLNGYLLLALLLPLSAVPTRKASALPPPSHGRPAACAVADTLPAHIGALLADTVAPAGHRPLRWLDVQATRAFYGRRGHAPAWSAGPQPSSAALAGLALLLQAEDYGLQPANYHAPALRALANQLAEPDSTTCRLLPQARFEVLLTDGLLQFARHLRRGQLRQTTPSPLEQADSLFEPAAWVAGALAAPDFAAALLGCQPPQREYQQLQRALARWRRRPVGRDSVARRERAQQLALTLERWRWTAIPASDSDYVLVNLPAYALEVVRGGRVRQTHRLVIGKPESPTPTLSSQLKVFTLSPEWRVPHSIATKELLPQLRESPRYAIDNNYVIYDAQGQPVNPRAVDWWDVRPDRFRYTIRQNPGQGNALGTVIFRFANPYEVYMHATSRPRDFTQAYRALGHGCMRVERPLRLAAFLLGADSTLAMLPPEPAPKAIKGARKAAPAAASRPRRVVLPRPVALHVRYATCAVVGGQLRFYPDVYEQDEALRAQLFGPRPPATEPARDAPTRPAAVLAARRGPATP